MEQREKLLKEKKVQVTAQRNELLQEKEFDEVHLELALLRQWHESVVEKREKLLKEKEVQVTVQSNELLQAKE